jgi:hypothetical protein
MKSYLFCGGELVREYAQIFPDMSEWLHGNFRLEIYNKGYVYTRKYHDRQRTWYRCDYTPVLLEDVPKEYRLLLLLLT